MKHINYILIVLLLTIVSISCKKKFLDITDNSNVNRQSYVKDLNSMQEFLNGIYFMLSTKYELNINTAYPELIADNLKVSGTNFPLAVHSNWSQITDAIRTSNSTSMNATWQNYYLIIRACNFVIEDVDKYASENAEKTKLIKGQAYAIRALVQFKLVNIFAQGYSFTKEASHPGVPYITTSDITKPYTRQTVAEVYSNLITDLQTAISLMPSTISDCRIMSGPAAKALLARVYLYKEDYTNAKTTAIELIKQFPLLSIDAGYPMNLFKNIPPLQTEVLFQLSPINQSAASSSFLGLYLEFEYYRATNDIVEILKENADDVRNSWVVSSGSNWKVKKFPASVAGGIAYHPSVDYYAPIARTSEATLIAAEACAKTNDETNARIYLNNIRKRANPSIPDLTTTGQALIDSIYKERRKELCFEGFRMFDLQSRRLNVQRFDVLPGFQTTLSYPSEKAIAPIPGQDVNSMGLKQNPGY